MMTFAIIKQIAKKLPPWDNPRGGSFVSYIRKNSLDFFGGTTIDVAFDHLFRQCVQKWYSVFHRAGMGKGSEQTLVIAAVAEDNNVVQIDAVELRSAFDHASFSRLVRGDFDVPRR